jgi:CheY-like chemotaxis protein
MHVDDNAAYLDELDAALRRGGYVVDEYSDPVRALAAYDPEKHGFVFTDMQMPGMTGIDLIIAMKKKPHSS